MAEMRVSQTDAEWPTLALLVACYGVWALALIWAASAWLPLAVVLATLAIALHSSLSHEVLHGHPTRNATINAALVFPALTVVVPYLRFRDTHLAHHHDESLTDPYDDPETNYLDPVSGRRCRHGARCCCRVNNTLAGG